MKYISMLVITFSLTACIENPIVKSHDVSPAQSYNFEGDKEATEISGLLEKYGNDWAYHGAFLTVKIGNEQVIEKQPVDKYDFSGIVSGGNYRDKKVSASCSSLAVTDRWADVRCTIFVGNEQTVTLTF